MHYAQTQAKMGVHRYQVLCVPLKRSDALTKRELDNQCFHRYNKQTRVFDKFLDAWASYCDGTREDAADMILFYMAKRFPQSYVKNFESVTRKHHKDDEPSRVELPPDFISYDGTSDIKWNTKYGELVKVRTESCAYAFFLIFLSSPHHSKPSLSSSIPTHTNSLTSLFQYRSEHENCKVYSKTELGKWVCSQRSARVTKAKNLTEKRIELLDESGFLWSGLPEGWTKPQPCGDPRQNRAIAAKLVYPDLTFREALRLGGFDEDELNAIKDQKHTWRTGEEIFQ
jgi:hypothetical protein